MTEDSYRIKYKKGDFEVEVQGDKAWVENKFKELTESSIFSKKSPSPTKSPNKEKKTDLSLVAFLRSKGNPKSNTKRALIFAYWLHHTENLESYNIVDIKRCYSESRIPLPSNLSESMNKLQAKDFLKLAPKEKEKMKTWIITLSGDEFVENLQ